MAGRKNIFAHHPVKALYTIYFMTAAFVRLSFFALYYIPRRLRPLPRWDYKAALGVQTAKLVFRYVSTVEFKTPVSLEPGKEGKRFITISPRADNLYRDVLIDEKIKPEVIGGVWYPTLYSRDVARDKKIVLHFHGGAFVLFDCREGICGVGLRTLSDRFEGAPVFCPQYRLATEATGRFPAPLQDSVTAYRYLLEDLKIDPSRIIVSGDSAGATLTIAFLRYITNLPSSGPSLPLPVAALLWSPWVNVSDVDHINRSRNMGIDSIEPCICIWGTQALTDHSTAIKPSNPYISPLQSPFYIPIPTWVLIGTAEVFYESVLSFVDSMQAAGNNINLYEIRDAPHDTLLASGLGFQTELEEGMKQAWQLIKENSE
jgi:acetyl esterase/lipase